MSLPGFLRRRPRVTARRLARAARVDTSFGCVDRPRPGAVLDASAFEVRGWYVGRDGRVPAAVSVSIDGVVVGWTEGGTGPRPDVVAAYDDPTWSRVGWSTRVPAPPRHGWAEVVVHVWPSTTARPRRLPPVRLYVRPPRVPRPPVVEGGLDQPVSGTPVDRAAAVVSGWALDRRGPVSGVRLAVDDGRGRDASAARLGLPRPDVAASRPGPHAGVCGFEAVLDLTSVPAEVSEVELEVTVDDHVGRPVVLTRRTLTLAPPPLVARGLLTPAVTRSLPDDDDLRLLVFTHHLGYGGGQLWLSTLLDRSGAGRAYPCTVLAPADGPLRPQLEALGIDVRVAVPAALGDPLGYRCRVDELSLVARAVGATAVLLNTTGSFVGADVAAACGLPVVWAIHESFSPEQFVAAAYPPGHLAPEVAGALYDALARSDAVVFEAEATRRLYLPAVPPARAVVVPYGVETGQIDAYCADTPRADVRAELGLAERARVVLVMGTTEPRKAQTVLAAAFAQVAAEFPDTVLVFVGHQPGPYGDALAAYLRDSGLEGRSLLVPVVADVRPWYRSADLLVCASDVESLPRSVLEAMCFGVPVLATRVFGLPELLTDGATGYLVEPRDLAALADALRRVLGAGVDELRAVGEAGQALVRTHHDAGGYAGEVLALLEGLRRDPLAEPAALLAAYRAVSAVGP